MTLTKRAALTMPPVQSAGASIPFVARLGAHQKILNRLERDLNLSIFDFTPRRVSTRELDSAHETLMSLPASVFAEVVRLLGPDLLSTYISKLAAEYPFRLDDSTPTPIVQFTQKLADELRPDPSGSALFITALSGEARRELHMAFLCLPTAAGKAEFARRVGSAGFERLMRGKEDTQSMLGAALWQEGMFFDNNDVPRFLDLYAQALSGEIERPAGTDDVDYAFAKGLLGNQAVGYFHPNLHVLEQTWELDPTLLEFNTGHRAAVNATTIYNEIRDLYEHNGGRKIILVAHSKGGLDTREAVRRHPQIKEMLAGVVMLQPAICSQVATAVHSGDGRFEPLFRPLVIAVDGDYGVAEDLAYSREATERLRTDPYPGDEIPTVVIATSYAEAGSALRPIGKLLESAYYAPSDGIVPTAEQAAGLPGASVVVLPGVEDHLFSVWNFEGVVHAIADLLAQRDMEGFEREVDKVESMLDSIDGLRPWAATWRLAIRKIAAAILEADSSMDDANRDLVVSENVGQLRRLAGRIDAAMYELRSANGAKPLHSGALTLAAIALVHEKIAEHASSVSETEPAE